MEGEMIKKSQTDESRRHTEAQRLRCLNLAKKLKTIQLEELQDYGREQMKAAVTTIAKSRGIKFTEKKKKPPAVVVPVSNGFCDEEQDRDRLGPHVHNTSLYARKKGQATAKDVTAMMKVNMKEALLATKMFATDDTDETDSDSDYEDEFESKASIRGPRDREEYQGYLVVEENPATKWARQRHDILTRWRWLSISIRNLSYRLKQSDEFTRHLKENKPAFKFDENPNPGNRSSNLLSADAAAALKDATIAIYHEDEIQSDAVYRSPVNTSQPRTPNTFVIPKGTSVIFDNKVLQSAESGAYVPPVFIKREPGVIIEGTTKGDIGGGLESLKLRILNPSDPTTTARRCLPVIKPFRTRKMFQLGGIHNIIGKPHKEPTSMCDCFGRTELCVVCSGRTDKMKPVKNLAMPSKQVSALLDHTYHKALCISEEKPLRRLIESSLKTEEWRKPVSLQNEITNRNDSSGDESDHQIIKPVYLHTKPIRESDTVIPPSPEKESPKKLARPARSDKKAKPKSKPSKKTAARKRRRASGDMDNDDDEDEEAAWAPTKRMKELSKRRNVNEKYDIDHIVIPYSIAAATRVEKIEYKEIMIPSWRMNHMEPLVRPPPKPGPTRVTRRRVKSASKNTGLEDDGFIEDISPETIRARHARSELEEKTRFLKAVNMLSNRKVRRSESKNPENPEGASSVSPISELTDNVLPVPLVVDETLLPGAANQITLADASLAVTALKLAKPNVSRRRTVSAGKTQEEEEADDPGYTPYDSRKFPLSEDDYNEMVREMEAAYEEAERYVATEPFDEPIY